MSNDPIIIGRNGAEAFFGRDIKKLKITGALRPGFAKAANGVLVEAYQREHLETIRRCLDTADRLFGAGYAEAVDGHLWVLRKNTSSNNGEPLYLPCDLATDGRYSPRLGLDGRGKIFRQGDASAKYGLTKERLVAAIGDAFPDISIFGIGGPRVFFEVELEKFKRELKSKINVENYKLISQLCRLPSVAQTQSAAKQGRETFMREVQQCAQLWAKQTEPTTGRPRLDSKEIHHKQAGRRNGKKPLLIQRRRRVFEADVFERLWGMFDEHAKLARKLIKESGENGMPVQELRDKMKEAGIAGIRFKRIIRAAGAIAKRGKPSVYLIVCQKNTPIRFAQSGDNTKAFLKAQLKDGPRLRLEILGNAGKRRGKKAIKRASLHIAYAAIWAESGEQKPKVYDFQTPAIDNKKKHGGRRVFWFMPEQVRPSDNDAQRLIANFYAKTARMTTDGKNRPALAPAHSEPEAELIVDDHLNAAEPGTGIEPDRETEVIEKKVVIIGNKVTVGGAKKTLLRSQLKCVKALYDAGPSGLLLDHFVNKSGCTDARKILKRLSNADRDWQEVILFPGHDGIPGYRLRM